MRNIQQYGPRIKQAGEALVGEWGLVGVVVLVGLSSFALGRFSALEAPRPPVSLTQAAEVAEPASRYLGAPLVASRSGSVYYYPWCSGAQNISPAKQVWFGSAAEAQKAGYRASKSCQGLE